MIYLDDHPEVFASKYGIDTKAKPCVKCKKKFKLIFPVAISGYRGMLADPHKCGEKYQRALFVPVGKDEIDFWMSVKHGVPK